MRLFLLAGLTLLAGATYAPSAPARARHPFRPPLHCPEFGADGFCPYDTGWRPARDNPLFSPLRPGDPQAQSGPICEVTDSHGRILLSYETEIPAPALRIGGRLVRFGPEGRDDTDRFIAAEGLLRIDEGAVVARAHESEGRRATLIFTERSGRVHMASVRVDCGV